MDIKQCKHLCVVQFYEHYYGDTYYIYPTYVISQDVVYKFITDKGCLLTEEHYNECFRKETKRQAIIKWNI